MDESREKKTGEEEEEKELTWDDVYELIGFVGLSYSEFWRLTWRQFFLYVEGYNKRDYGEWCRVREIVAMIYNTSVSKKSHQKKATELMPLTFDPEPVKKDKKTLEDEFREARKSIPNEKLPKKWRR